MDTIGYKWDIYGNVLARNISQDVQATMYSLSGYGMVSFTPISTPNSLPDHVGSSKRIPQI